MGQIKNKGFHWYMSPMLDNGVVLLEFQHFAYIAKPSDTKMWKRPLGGQHFGLGMFLGILDMIGISKHQVEKMCSSGVWEALLSTRLKDDQRDYKYVYLDVKQVKYLLAKILNPVKYKTLQILSSETSLNLSRSHSKVLLLIW